MDERLAIALDNLNNQLAILNLSIQRLTGTVETGSAQPPSPFKELQSGVERGQVYDYSYQAARLFGRTEGSGAPISQLTPSQYGVYRPLMPPPSPYQFQAEYAHGFRYFPGTWMYAVPTPPAVYPFEYVQSMADRQSEHSMAILSTVASHLTSGITTVATGRYTPYATAILSGIATRSFWGALAGFGASEAFSSLFRPILREVQDFQRGYVGVFERIREATYPSVVSGPFLNYFGRGMSFMGLHHLTNLVEQTVIEPEFRFGTGMAYGRRTLLTVLTQGAQAGLFDMYQTPVEITRQLRNTARAVRALMHIMEDPDIRNVIQELGRFRTAGLGLGEAVTAAYNVRQAARMAGTTYRAIMDTVAAAGGEFFQGFGFTAGLGMQVGAFTQGVARQAVAAQVFTPQQLALAGGIGGVQQTLMQATAATLGMSIPLAATLSRAPGGGLFVNPEMTRRLLLGAMTTQEMVSTAAERIAATGGVSSIVELSWRQRELQDVLGRQLGPQGSILLLFQQARMLRDMMGGEVDLGFAFRMLGFSPQQAQALTRMATSQAFWRNLEQQEQLRTRDILFGRLQYANYVSSLGARFFMPGRFIPEIRYQVGRMGTNLITELQEYFNITNRRRQAEHMGGYYVPENYLATLGPHLSREARIGMLEAAGNLGVPVYHTNAEDYLYHVFPRVMVRDVLPNLAFAGASARFGGRLLPGLVASMGVSSIVDVTAFAPRSGPELVDAIVNRDLFGYGLRAAGWVSGWVSAIPHPIAIAAGTVGSIATSYLSYLRTGEVIGSPEYRNTVFAYAHAAEQLLGPGSERRVTNRELTRLARKFGMKREQFEGILAQVARQIEDEFAPGVVDQFVDWVMGSPSFDPRKLDAIFQRAGLNPSNLEDRKDLLNIIVRYGRERGIIRHTTAQYISAGASRLGGIVSNLELESMRRQVEENVTPTLQEAYLEVNPIYGAISGRTLFGFVTDLVGKVSTDAEKWMREHAGLLEGLSEYFFGGALLGYGIRYAYRKLGGDINKAEQEQTARFIREKLPGKYFFAYLYARASSPAKRREIVNMYARMARISKEQADNELNSARYEAEQRIANAPKVVKDELEGMAKLAEKGKYDEILGTYRGIMVAPIVEGIAELREHGLGEYGITAEEIRPVRTLEDIGALIKERYEELDRKPNLTPDERAQYRALRAFIDKTLSMYGLSAEDLEAGNMKAIKVLGLEASIKHAKPGESKLGIGKGSTTTGVAMGMLSDLLSEQYNTLQTMTEEERKEALKDMDEEERFELAVNAFVEAVNVFSQNVSSGSMQIGNVGPNPGFGG